MLKASLFSSLVFFSITAYGDLRETAVLSAYQHASAQPIKCPVSARPVVAGLRHIEGKGIGYNQGYTTLELLVRPEWNGYSMFPFLDLRGHVFDDGKFAGNAGVGFRYRTPSRIWGLNAYYDYRRTHKYRYNQVGVGFETLGKTWDFRLNGYLPVGTHESRWYDLKFDKFKGHNLYLQRKQEFAMRGANGEVGVHFTNSTSLDVYTAAGPYYFEGKGKHALGGKVRLGTKWSDCFSLELSGSYDNLFHGIVQGEIGFYLPLGPKAKAKPKGLVTCSDFKVVMDRMIRQPVVRNEIIVLDKRREHFVARDPTTGDPYVFWFVNNLGHSNGTFESPFPALNTALGVANPGNIIYIFPGDGTSTGLDAMGGTFQLQNNQQLWGAGATQFIETQLGTIKVPPLASSLPLITGTSEIITVANNNKISGLHIFANGGIGIGLATGASINNLTVTNSQFNVPGNSKGISSTLIGGLITISNNIFNSSGVGGPNPSFGAGIDLEPVNLNITAVITNNFISAHTNGFFRSIFFNATNSHLNVLASANTIVNGQFGLLLQGSGEFTSTVQNNNFINCGFPLQMAAIRVGRFFVTSNFITGGSMGMLLDGSRIIVQNNTVVNSGFQGIVANGTLGSSTIHVISNKLQKMPPQAVTLGAGNSVCCVRFQNNQADNTYTFNQAFGTFNLEPFLANTPNTFTKIGTINSVPQGACGN